jgi:hypothetical protein
MAKFAQGVFTPKNPQKYVGLGKPRYRSGWEFTFMQFADNNDHVLQWASESVRIPYRNPLTGKQTIYVPDFLVVYQNKTGRQVAELIEIKPLKQTSLQEAGRSRQAQAAAIVNQAKWEAAQNWCRRAGITFRVITENDIFRNGSK